MPSHRFLGEGEIATYPRASAPGVSVEGFVVCPLPFQAQAGDAGAWMRDVYRIAYEQAKATLAPPWHERNLFACMN